MYFIRTYTELATGFRLANLSNKDWKDKEGMKLELTKETEHHNQAIKLYRLQLAENLKFNLSLDPNYMPPSRR